MLFSLYYRSAMLTGADEAAQRRVMGQYGHEGWNQAVSASVPSAETGPLVSVGLPVYNGDRWLDAAITSILTQTFTDLELIICDNGSTDRTAEICRSWAGRDARVRYYRNPENIGLIPNHNRTFELARGEYFLWFSYDDLHLPESLARRVAYLQAHPGVNLVYTATETIDETGRTVRGAAQGTFQINSTDPRTRFEVAINRIPPEEAAFYGLIRRSAAARTLLLRNCHGADGIFLSELALLGPFAKIPDVLFQRRLHPENIPTSQEMPWRFRPELSGKLIFPQWRLTGEDIRTILRAPISLPLRLSLLGVVARRIRTHASLMKTELGFAWYYVRQRLTGNNPTLSPADRAAREAARRQQTHTMTRGR